ncbi:MAG: hypothetical protein ACFHX7_05095 [Pseudomonadota bacterium]
MFVQKLVFALAILAITYHVNASPEARLITSNLPQDRIIDLELSEPEMRDALTEKYERFRYVDVDSETISQIISGEKPIILVEFFDGVFAKVQIESVKSFDFAAYKAWTFEARLLDFPGKVKDVLLGTIRANHRTPTLNFKITTEDGTYLLTNDARRGTQIVAKRRSIGNEVPECGVDDSVGPLTEEQITQALQDQRTAYQEYQQRMIYDPDNPSPERIARIQGVLQMWRDQPELREIAEDELKRLGVGLPDAEGKQ